jgi:hypothetical protein
MDIYEILGTIVTASFTGYVTFRIQERRLKQELKTEFMAERVATELLSDARWPKRSFEEIKKRLGGFEDTELRKILVRAGAVRFEQKDGGELWGLLSRNKADL